MPHPESHCIKWLKQGLPCGLGSGLADAEVDDVGEVSIAGAIRVGVTALVPVQIVERMMAAQAIKEQTLKIVSVIAKEPVHELSDVVKVLKGPAKVVEAVAAAEEKGASPNWIMEVIGLIPATALTKPSLISGEEVLLSGTRELRKEQKKSLSSTSETAVNAVRIGEEKLSQAFGQALGNTIDLSKGEGVVDAVAAPAQGVEAPLFEWFVPAVIASLVVFMSRVATQLRAGPLPFQQFMERQFPRGIRGMGAVPGRGGLRAVPGGRGAAGGMFFEQDINALVLEGALRP